MTTYVQITAASRRRAAKRAARRVAGVSRQLDHAPPPGPPPGLPPGTCEICKVRPGKPIGEIGGPGGTRPINVCEECSQDRAAVVAHARRLFAAWEATRAAAEHATG